MSDPTKRPDDADARLERDLEESFPASDPSTVTRSLPEEEQARLRREAACKIAESAALDEALEESFPASDPPSMTAPGGEECPLPDDAAQEGAPRKD